MSTQRYNTSLYQVDFVAEATGKTLGSTKRKIRFRFGFANPEALAQGKVGVQCRGEEHEVLCIWSVTSGKQIVTLDGREVHHSVGGFQGKLECTFNFGKNHFMKVIAHAAPPLTETMINGLKQRQFDLFLDGLSFFEFPKVFELGRNPVNNTVTYPTNNSTTYKNYSLPQNTSSHIADTFREDYSSQAKKLSSSAATAPAIVQKAAHKKEQELIDFSSESVCTVTTVQTTNSFATESQPIANSMTSAPPTYYTSNANSNSFAGLSTELLPYQQYQQKVAQYDVLSKYNAPTAPAPYKPEYQEHSTALVPFAPVKLSMEPANIFDDHHVSRQCSNEAETDKLSIAMKKLVNFDNICEVSQSKQVEKLPSARLLSMNNKTTSQKFSTSTSSYYNSNASLAEIQASKGGKQQPMQLSSVLKVTAPNPSHSAVVRDVALFGVPNGGVPPTHGNFYSSVGYGQYQQHQQVPQAYNNYQFAH
mmetsp:Transcript_3657/g.5460  ORF Transcript_3657/g.5460 Transcript_3657/m.5460 type:complete len:476 (-) Transcript_3657:134-1561(-)|eukprot:CAMPEP_0172426424 /NCGR_PEP_ID=MMETSP1064-20121228/37326_1 /TAXON_ID=202472 /ORGANISM="Aulacoseira subarctica , Strain CCAP 1002/5" /LENGTH=475 /DNA_ID=CAMNT_0013170011 /DNA_START=93 /DNA_END=1520 /DNA_ORIENTATION=+